MKQLKSVFRIPDKMVLLARNGFDHKEFGVYLSKEDARKRLGLPLVRPIVMYTGHLYDWKGVDILVQSANLISDALFILVGGSQEEISSLAKRQQLGGNVMLLGQKPHKDIPYFFAASDVLVLPNSSYSTNRRFVDYSTFDTSPIKMFEYMASGRPIVASSLPSIMEVLNEQNSVLIGPDNPRALVAGIRSVLSDKELAERLSARACIEARDYTWERRAEKILEFIKSLS